MRKTPLFESHASLGAKFTEFGGWEMPVRYKGLVEEHNCVRKRVGLFDVSHMGEILIKGENALRFLQMATTNDLSKVSMGQAQYALLCNQSGGVVDDIISYFVSDNEYLLCVNAANTQKDVEWLSLQLNSLGLDSVSIEDVSSNYGQIAVQGPKARELVGEIFSQYREISTLKPFSFICEKPQTGDFDLLIACTGYTGEDGFEIFCKTAATLEIWNQLLAVGEQFGVQPIGLGARDTLRLEVAYPLHGHELKDDLLALSSNVSWTIKFDKEFFIGKEALVQAKEKGVSQNLIGFEVIDRGIAREGARIFNQDDLEIGWVSSGTMTPTVGRAIGLAFVDTQKMSVSTEIFAEIRSKKLQIRKVKLPFYRSKK